MGWVYLRRCAYRHSALVLCCEGFLSPVFLTQRDEAQRIEVQSVISVSRFSIFNLYSPFRSPWEQLH